MHGEGRFGGLLPLFRKTMDKKKKAPPAERRDPNQLNAFERFYEHFRGTPLKYLDIFIGVCVAAIVVVVIAGMLKSRGFF